MLDCGQRCSDISEIMLADKAAETFEVRLYQANLKTKKTNPHKERKTKILTNNVKTF